jgi:hypothetical protein
MAIAMAMTGTNITIAFCLAVLPPGFGAATVKREPQFQALFAVSTKEFSFYRIFSLTAFRQSGTIMLVVDSVMLLRKRETRNLS